MRKDDTKTTIVLPFACIEKSGRPDNLSRAEAIYTSVATCGCNSAKMRRDRKCTNYSLVHSYDNAYNQSADGILSTSSLNARQLSACSSAYFTRS
jgi:hypothetical protein